MPKRTCALESGGPQRLEIDWKPVWRDVTLRLDGQIIGTVATQKELSAGKEFPLPDGSVLRIQLVSGLAAAELRLLRDGRPLPGSDSDPLVKIKNASIVLYFLAAVNVVLGLAASLFQVQFLLMTGIGWFSVIYGLAFLLLGMFVGRRSLPALILAIVLYFIDSIAGIWFSAASGGPTATGSILMRVIILVPLFQGVMALRSLQKEPVSKQPGD